MPKFGKRSKERLSTCCNSLQLIMNELILVMDVTILCGQRNEADQNKAFKEGKSQLQYPESSHNMYPSMAVDVSPYPIEWPDKKNDSLEEYTRKLGRFERMCGIIEGIASTLGFKVRLGRDFSFKDYVHTEVK